MPSGPPLPQPSREALLTEVTALRQRILELEQDKQDLEIMLEMATDHADDLSDVLEQERDDLQVVLEMTTDHADAVEEELHSKAETLEARNQFIRNTFGRYVSDEVVAQLLDAPEGLELGGEKRTVTILMSDLRGFTVLAERLDPQQVMTFLNRYLEAMVTCILGYQGTIIEILGDGLLVLFGAPICRDDDAERAVACALTMQLRMAEVNTLLRQEGLPEIEMGIGLHSGDVVVGNIGSQQRAKYGVVGSAVNLTGRIESYTTGNQVLVSPTTYQATADLLSIRQRLTVTPKGVAQPITLYDVGGLRGEHDLLLPDATEPLVPLQRAIAVRYTVLEGKFAGDSVLKGRLLQVSTRAAELQSDQPVDVFSNLKLQLLHDNGDSVPGELFAKVVEVPAESACRAVLRFTSLSEAAKTWFTTLIPSEYQLISRSEQRRRGSLNE